MADVKVLGTEEHVQEVQATPVQETAETTQPQATQDNQNEPLPVTPVTPVPSYAADLADEEPEGETDENKEVGAPKFLSLEEILGKDTEELTREAQGHFTTSKLGTIPFTAISYDDYKQAKKDCVTYEQDDNGIIQTKVDDDKLMTKIVILAVDKDKRSDFTFANGALLKKLGVFTAEMALGKLLSPGEIVNFAVKVQNASGFGTKKKKQIKESVKNS
jgi:hypothetical protein